MNKGTKRNIISITPALAYTAGIVAFITGYNEGSNLFTTVFVAGLFIIFCIMGMCYFTVDELLEETQ